MNSVLCSVRRVLIIRLDKDWMIVHIRNSLNWLHFCSYDLPTIWNHSKNSIHFGNPKISIKMFFSSFFLLPLHPLWHMFICFNLLKSIRNWIQTDLNLSGWMNDYETGELCKLERFITNGMNWRIDSKHGNFHSSNIQFSRPSDAVDKIDTNWPSCFLCDVMT